MTITHFRKIIWDYYRRHGRDFPWRRTRDPYRILVSEVMLQQTQVSRVLAYYPRFIRVFPNFEALHRESLSRVLRVWQGLGYNRRALALKKIAAFVVEQYGGRLPRRPEELEKLPGIGPATAAAIAAFAWNIPAVFIETNIQSAFIHLFFARRRKVGDYELLPLLERALDRRRPREWYWALMDYGAHLKATRPNPSRKSAVHKQQTPFVGSLREVRGKIIRLLLGGGARTPRIAARILGVPVQRIEKALRGLIREGLVARRGNGILIGDGYRKTA